MHARPGASSAARALLHWALLLLVFAGWRQTHGSSELFLAGCMFGVAPGRIWIARGWAPFISEVAQLAVIWTLAFGDVFRSNPATSHGHSPLGDDALIVAGYLIGVAVRLGLNGPSLNAADREVLGSMSSKGGQ